MSHEPECWYASDNPGLVPPGYCICARLRAAYQRGRADAAQAVSEMDDLTGYDLDGLVPQWDAANVARGDGDQS